MSERKKHVYIVFNEFTLGGIQRAFIRLAIGLYESGVQVTVLTCLNEGPLGELLPPEIPIVVLANAVAPRKSIKLLAQHLKKDQPDAMMSGDDGVNMTIVIAKKLARVKTRAVIGVHHSLFNKYAHETRWGRIKGKLLKYFYQFADGVIAVSEGAKKEFYEFTGLTKMKVDVIYPVLGTGLREKAQEPWEDQPFAGSKDPLVLAIGRLHIQKNYPNMFRAFKLLLEKRPANLLIYGEGPEREALDQMVKDMGLQDRVAMPGTVMNPYPAMDQATVYAMSSSWEGAPLVLCEAMFFGMSVVSTDCPFGPREILEGGKWGRLVAMDDPQALCDGLIDAINEGKKPLNPESWDRYTVETSVRRHTEVLLG